MLDRRTDPRNNIDARLAAARLAAQRTGDLIGYTPRQWCGYFGGWRTKWDGYDELPAYARAGIIRRGIPKPFYATAASATYGEWVVGKDGPQLCPCWEQFAPMFLADLAELFVLLQAFPEAAAVMAGTDRAVARWTYDANADDGSVRTPCLSEVIEDVLHRASWNERLPALYATGDAEIVELVHGQGMPTDKPVDLLREAVALIEADIARLQQRPLTQITFQETR